MTSYDQRLQDLRQKIGQKEHLENKLEDLRDQRKTLTCKVEQLEQLKKKEQKDVERIEGNIIVSLFYVIAGMKETRLEKEQQEVYTAKAKYDVAVQELKNVEEEIHICKIKLDNLERYKERYSQLLKEKIELIKDTRKVATEEILLLENQLARLERQKIEVAEALAAGDHALHTTKLILLKLEDANEWGLWDLIGGETISTLIKHSYLDEAEELVRTLQKELRQFKTELADTEIIADIQVDMDEFLLFADIFFDSLFTDIAALGHIQQCKEKTQEVKDQIEILLKKLQVMQETNIMQECVEVEKCLKEIAEKTSL